MLILMLEIEVSISRDPRASNKDVASQLIDDKWSIDMTVKKKIKAKWELNRNFQETWVTKFSWAKLIVGPSDKMHMVCWNMYSTMDRKVS
jgi:hypothetical protein